MHSTIKNKNYLSAKMLVEDPYFTSNAQIPELRKEVANLLENSKNKKEDFKLQIRALRKVVLIIKKECLPKTDILSEDALRKINTYLYKS